MTLASSQSKVSYVAAGSASEAFTVPFKFFADADLQVFLAGVLQTLNTNYTVAGAGSQSGGTVTWVGTPTAAATVRIIRRVDATQETDYGETGPFPAETHEAGLDKVTMVAQQSIQRSSTDAAKFDAESDIIENVADPVAAQDAATKAFVQAQTFVASTSIAAPADPADDDKGLIASGGALTYDVVLVPIPVSADVAKVLSPTAAGVYDWHDQFFRNLIVNGDARIVQRGTTFTAATTPANDDDTWLLDRWLLLSDGNDRVDVSQELVEIPTAARSAIKLEVETVTAGPNAEKFGIAQVLEAKDSFTLQGRTVSLSFKARTTTGAAIRNIRAAIMQWATPGDSVTSDMVGASWQPEGTNPDLAGVWTRANTPADIPVTADSYATHKIEGITLNSTFKNLGIFIWVDDTDHVAGDVLYIADVQLEVSDIAHDFHARDMGTELQLCQRFYNKTFDQDVAPAQSAGADGSLATVGNHSTGDFMSQYRYPVTMFRAPTLTTYNPAAANASARNTADSTDTAVTVENIGHSGCHIRPTTPDTDDANDFMLLHVSAEAEL